MTEYTTEWVRTQLSFTATQTTGYTEHEKISASVTYLTKVLEIIPLKAVNENELASFRTKVETLLSQLPLKTAGEPVAFGRYTSTMKDLTEYISKTFRIVPKGHYKRRWIPAGIALGLPYGLLFKNLALGIPIGIVLGVLIGSALDKKAERENRVI